MSQRTFGSQVGSVGINTVSMWECGTRQPRLAMALKIRQLAEMNGLEMDKLEDPDYFRKQLAVRVFAPTKSSQQYQTQPEEKYESV